MGAVSLLKLGVPALGRMNEQPASRPCPCLPSCRLVRGRARVVDITLDRLAATGRHRDVRNAFGRDEPAPCPLRNDSHRPGSKRERLWRPVVPREFQARRAIENVNDLLAAEMALPGIFPRSLGRQQETVAVGRQFRDAAVAIRRRRLGSPPDHRQRGEFSTEIDDARRSVCKWDVLGRRGHVWPRVGDIELTMRTGNHGAPRQCVTHGVKAVPCPLRDDCDRSGAKLKGPGRSVVAHDLQSLRAVEHVDELVLGMDLPMAPMARARVRAEEEVSAAVSAQARYAAVTPRGRRLWAHSVQCRELFRFCVEIDDGQHLALLEFCPHSALRNRPSLAPRSGGWYRRFPRTLKRFRGTRTTAVSEKTDAPADRRWRLLRNTQISFRAE